MGGQIHQPRIECSQSCVGINSHFSLALATAMLSQMSPLNPPSTRPPEDLLLTILNDTNKHQKHGNQHAVPPSKVHHHTSPKAPPTAACSAEVQADEVMRQGRLVRPRPKLFAKLVEGT